MKPVGANHARRTAASSKTAESVAGVDPLAIVGRYCHWTVGRVASARSNVECSARARLQGPDAKDGMLITIIKEHVHPVYSFAALSKQGGGTVALTNIGPPAIGRP